VQNQLEFAKFKRRERLHAKKESRELWRRSLGRNVGGGVWLFYLFIDDTRLIQYRSQGAKLFFTGEISPKRKEIK
jgi:hypothetical protein